MRWLHRLYRRLMRLGDGRRRVVRKWRAGRLVSARDNMAFVGLLSGRILAQDFGPGFESRISGQVLDDDSIAWRMK